MVVYWAKQVSSNQNKISNMIYTILYNLHDSQIFKSDWISTVRSILNDSGLSGCLRLYPFLLFVCVII